METKTAHIAIKAAGEGKATVVIATLGVKDRDGDVLLPGAFGEQIVPVVGAHDWKMYQIGKARITEIGNEAVAEIKFYLTTDAGKNWYNSIKEDFDDPPARQQYSWGFSVGPQNFKHGSHEGQQVRFLKASDDGHPIAIHEVSPVLVAAGHNTRSVTVKEGTPEASAPSTSTPPIAPLESGARLVTVTPAAHRAITPHTDATDDSPWNAFLMQRYVKATAEHAHYYHKGYAMADVPGSTKRLNYRGLHHVVAPDGTIGAANQHACLWLKYMLHLGVFPAEERDGINAHIDQHLRDMGVEPSKLTAADDYGYPLKMRFDILIAQNKAAVDEAMTLHEIRSAKGLGLTEPFMRQCGELKQTWDAFAHVVHLIDAAPRDEALREFAEREFLHNLNQKIEGLEKAAQEKVDEVNRSIAEEHYQRFLELDRKIRGDG